MTIADLQPEHRREWDRLVASNPASGFMQSWAWSEFKQLEGYDVIRLGSFDGARLVGGAMAYLSAGVCEVNLMAIPDGPVLDWNDAVAATRLAELTEALAARALQHRVIAIRIGPRLVERPAFLQSLLRAPVDLVPQETLEIPLQDPEAMLSTMKPKGRYNIRLARRHGVVVHTSTHTGDVHEFHDLLRQTAARQGFHCEPKGFFINLCRALFPASGRLVFARHRGQTLAAALTVQHGHVLTYLYGGIRSPAPPVMANYGLHWHILCEGFSEGLQTYDLYGFIAAGTPGHPYDRFSRFKEKFGGRHVTRMGALDIVLIDRMADIAIDLMRHLPMEPDDARPALDH